MFSEIARDDVFRIETPRLWLRWPKAGDVAAVARCAALRDAARWSAPAAQPQPADAAQNFILTSRSKNMSGEALNLVATPIRSPRDAIGTIGLEPRSNGHLTLGYAFWPEHLAEGLAGEAVRALIDAAFVLTPAPAIYSSARAESAGSLHVLEECGFVDLAAPGDDASAPPDALKKALTRKDWLARRSLVAANALGASSARMAAHR